MAQAVSPAPAGGSSLVGSSWRERLPTGWFFLIPTFILFIGWQLYPIIEVARISFTDYHFLRLGQAVNFIGFENFRQALADPLLRQGLIRAAIFTALFVPGMIFFPMFVATLVDRVVDQ